MQTGRWHEVDGPSSTQLRIPATTGTTETTPPHNTRNHAMKYYPPTLHTQHDAMKHLPPQHAINNQNSPIFTMQGRTFFHNTHHTPTPGRHFFQPTGPSPHQTQATHNSTTTGAQHCEPTGTNRTPERNRLRHHRQWGKTPEKGQVLWSGVIVLCPSGWVMR